MKIAVISDIHANKLALESVLDDIKLYNPDKIFCLGDIILAGYNPNGTVEEIIKLKNKMGENFIIIQGNTDKMVAEATDKMIEKTKELYPCMGFSLEDDIKITKKEYIDFVKKLREKENITLNGLKIELVHGSPRKQDENIFPDLNPDEVEKMVENSSAELILCAHTHIPCGYSLKSGKTVINVGSVGRSMAQNKKACYLRLEIDKFSKFAVEHREIEYDRNIVKNLILSRALEHCEDLANMF